MCHSPTSVDDHKGWPGLFRPLKHYVPPGSRLLQIRDLQVAPGFPCGSMCEPPTDTTADLPWCPECRGHLDWLWPQPKPEEKPQ